MTAHLAVHSLALTSSQHDIEELENEEADAHTQYHGDVVREQVPHSIQTANGVDGRVAAIEIGCLGKECW